MLIFVNVGVLREVVKKYKNFSTKVLNAPSICFISIFELKVMVKIGVIFMSFSNPTCHFRDIADFTVCTVCTLCKVSCISEMVSRI